jgi:hypothetical protein
MHSSTRHREPLHPSSGDDDPQIEDSPATNLLSAAPSPPPPNLSSHPIASDVRGPNAFDSPWSMQAQKNPFQSPNEALRSHEIEVMAPYSPYLLTDTQLEAPDGENDPIEPDWQLEGGASDEIQNYSLIPTFDEFGRGESIFLCLKRRFTGTASLLSNCTTILFISFSDVKSFPIF